jgi:DNA-binding CsgD family transcriptional regulator
VDRPSWASVPETSLVERDAELAALVSAFDSARAGAGSVLWIEGPAGIGKTALAAAARERAERDGLRVLHGRGSEFEREYPFGVVRQCLEPVVRRADDRERLLHGAARLAEPVLMGAPDGIDAAPVGLLHGLYWLVADLAEATPAALVVDDAHWADEPSLRFLAYLVRRIDSLRVALVICTRPGDEDGGAAGLAEVRGEIKRGRLELRPLGAQAAAQLLRDFGSQDVDDAFAGACHEATGGNPFLLEELAYTLMSEDVPFTAASAERIGTVAPSTVARWVAATLARLGQDAQTLARAAAVLGDGAALDLAAEVGGVPITETTPAAAGLVRAGLLSDAPELRFRHPILGGAVRASLSAVERVAAHARAADVLRARGAAPERVALQLLHAAPAGSEQVVDDLRRAADSARAGGAPDTAAVLLQRALAEPPRQQLRADLLLELGQAQLESGQAQRAAAHLLEAHGCAADPVTRARAVVLLHQATPGRPEHRRRVTGLVEAAIAEVQPHDPDLALRLRGLLALEGRLAQIPDLDGDTLAHADFLGHAVFARMTPDASATDIADIAGRAARQADALSVQGAASLGFSGMMLGLIWTDRLEDALRVGDAAIAAARRSGSTASFASAITMRAHAHRRAGRLRDAEADARTALEATLDPEWWFARGLAPLLCTLVCQGRDEDAERELADALRGGEIHESPPMTTVLLARMWVRAARRRHASALADWRDALSWIRPRRPNAAWIEDLAVAADLHVAAGDHEGAAAIVDEAVGVAEAWGTPRARGMALHSRARVAGGDDVVDLLRRATELLAESPARFEEAKARVSLGAALRRAGHRVESRAPLREGYELAQRCGAEGLVELARSELRASGIRLSREVATGADALTPSERRIAEMAAAGLSNPEIAQELFLTIKTIEMHLTRSYRKLDVRGRGELAQALDD